MKRRYLTRQRTSHKFIVPPMSQSALYNQQQKIEWEQRVLEQNIFLLNETLHEVRKINNQLKASILQLSHALNSVYIDASKSNEIENIRKNIEANTSLLSIRMDAYDMILNPESIENEMVVSIPVYKKIEKVYKCLYAQKKEKNIEIQMSGHSIQCFRLSNTIELAFFIVIDNAIKYSRENGVITIKFMNYTCSLEVSFMNWGIRPLEEEWTHLTERGFRSKTIIDKTTIKGSGLGLFLLQQICDLNNVVLNIHIGNERKIIDGLTYSPFIVKFTFSEQ